MSSTPSSLSTKVDVRSLDIASDVDVIVSSPDEKPEVDDDLRLSRDLDSTVALVTILSLDMEGELAMGIRYSFDSGVLPEIEATLLLESDVELCVGSTFPLDSIREAEVSSTLLASDVEASLICRSSADECSDGTADIAALSSMDPSIQQEGATVSKGAQPEVASGATELEQWTAFSDGLVGYVAEV